MPKTLTTMICLLVLWLCGFCTRSDCSRCTATHW